jgi:hypothetical protein
MAHAVSRATEDQCDRAGAYELVRAWPSVAPGLQLFSDTLHMPFDVMRSQHAQAVHAGLMANSILESRDFENGLDALEHICLGPFARHV